MKEVVSSNGDLHTAEALSARLIDDAIENLPDNGFANKRSRAVIAVWLNSTNYIPRWKIGYIISRTRTCRHIIMMVCGQEMRSGPEQGNRK